jgi:hypothetical protein
MGRAPIFPNNKLVIIVHLKSGFSCYFLKKNAVEDKKSAKYGDRADKKAFR